MYYPSTNDSVDNSDPRFATLGNSGPTALNQSSLGTGQQQRANVSLHHDPNAGSNALVSSQKFNTSQ